MRESDALELIRALNAAWPREALEPESVKIYVDCLADLSDYAAAEKAVRSLIETGDRFPSISVLREVYRSYRRLHLREFAESHGIPEPDAAPPPEWFELGKRLGASVEQGGT